MPLPVSHLGLTVSNLPRAVTFYESALRPLGYRFIGERGDSVGFGITDADFFVSRGRDGMRVAPMHLAFAADSRSVVRDCYAAALNGGGRPSGSPEYREPGCDCFNAAVEDLDGNTIEFIFRESSKDGDAAPSPPRTVVSGAQSQQGELVRGGFRENTDVLTSLANKAQTTAQTAIQLAASMSKARPAKKDAHVRGIIRSKTEPLPAPSKSGNTNLVGGLLGAAAGAALVFTMFKGERNNAAEEKRFASSVRSRDSTSRSWEAKASSRPSHTRRGSLPSYGPPPALDKYSSRYEYDYDPYGPRSPRDRPPFSRSRTYEAIDYRPRANSLDRSERLVPRQSSTMPLALETPYDHEPRLRPSRRRSIDESQSQDSRHDSGVSFRSGSHRTRRSSYSKHSSKPSKASTSSTIKPPPHRHNVQYDAAANVPLPMSRGTSYVTKPSDTPSRAPPVAKSRSYTSAARVPLPESCASTSYISAANLDMVGGSGYSANAAADIEGLSDFGTVLPDDSISVVDGSPSSSKQDKKTSKPGSKSAKREPERRSSKSSRHGSRRSSRHEGSEQSTVVRAAAVQQQPSRSSRHSVKTLPMRSREEHGDRGSKSERRSAVTYA